MFRLVLFTVAGLLFSCGVENSQQELFDTVWQTIYETYPDRTFNGADWETVRKDYQLQLDPTLTDDDMIDLLNRMLFELKVSHTFFGKRSLIKEKASPYMFRPGCPGVDIRIVDQKVIVTKLLETFESEISTLRPGQQLLKIDNVDVADIMASTDIYPPYNDRYKIFLQTEQLLRSLYGEVGESVVVEYENIDGSRGVTEIIRTKHGTAFSLTPELPPIHIETEWKILNDDIGYFRFNSFQAAVPGALLDVMDSLALTRGLVIDLRGNNGGSLDILQELAGRFFKQQVPGLILESRNQLDTLFFGNNDVNSYLAPVAVLVDEVSISGAELFAATMQYYNRAVIVGNQTPGAVMGGEGMFIDHDLIFVHPIFIVRTADGNSLEGVGVIPDITVLPDPEQLCLGIDNQLKAAVDYLNSTGN